jgi:hypothetical protein
MDEKIRFEYNPNVSELKDALVEVYKYIIKTNSILVGGMALDSALQLKGDKIYDQRVTVPDYDFMNPDSVNISYDLVDVLHKKGFSNVDVVKAVHTTTMRVRVNWYVVADITYIPKDIFDKISTLEFKGMRTIHPAYTMMDQLDSLSRPYVNPPLEVALGRWEKDWKRMKLISKYYSFAIDPEVKDNNYLNGEHKYIFCKGFNVLYSALPLHSVISGCTGVSFYVTDKKHSKNLPVIYDAENDYLKAVGKEFARITILVGTAPSTWWKHLSMHKFAKNATKIIYRNESLSYPYTVELHYEDYILELVYMNFNCITYNKVKLSNNIEYEVHPLVGCLWAIANRALLYHDNNYSMAATFIMKAYLFSTQMLIGQKISTTAVSTGNMVNHSLRLSLEYHHTRTEKKRLSNKKNIYVPSGYNPNISKPERFDYSKSYYFTVLDTKEISSTKFITSISSLETLSQYLDIA